MSDYIAYEFKIYPIEWREILMAELSLFSFESMEETQDGLIAYIPAHQDDFEPMGIPLFENEDAEIAYKKTIVPRKNWNKVWEEQFEPIEVENKVRIRASFHAPTADDRVEIIINPKMSFGTGHHQTTYLMIKNMLEIPLENKKVLDAGCGTGILAILAKKLNAGYTLGFDIDEWAVENSKENAALNDVDVNFQKGTINTVTEQGFDLILANIQKNILLHDLPYYERAIAPQGLILLSGFMLPDLEDMKSALYQSNFENIDYIQKEEWICIKAIKK